ncbi:MAG: DUF5320 domain-containing protein [Pirellulales bacterium]|nr:DUF5320 domain-containing protein [Pirellulales bacterium]
MPGGDRTGPMGMGPMTGRGAGYCAGFAVPGFANNVFGGGSFGRGFFGRGRGGGRGWRNMYYATGLPAWARMGGGMAGAPLAAGVYGGITQEQELIFLKQQADQMASALESIRQRISEVESKTQQ